VPVTVPLGDPVEQAEGDVVAEALLQAEPVTVRVGLALALLHSVEVGEVVGLAVGHTVTVPHRVPLALTVLLWDSVPDCVEQLLWERVRDTVAVAVLLRHCVGVAETQEEEEGLTDCVCVTEGEALELEHTEAEKDCVLQLLCDRVSDTLEVTEALKHSVPVPDPDDVALGHMLPVRDTLLVRLRDTLPLPVRDTLGEPEGVLVTLSVAQAVEVPQGVAEVEVEKVTLGLALRERVTEGVRDTLTQAEGEREPLGLLLPLRVAELQKEPEGL
jgi:hypothetical protein